MDDNQRYRGQLHRMIGRAYPQAMIYEAENTAAAIHLTKQVAFKIALVDVVLGDEDGICCTWRIKANSPSSRVILISTYPDREFQRRGLQAGATVFWIRKIWIRPRFTRSLTILLPERRSARRLQPGIPQPIWSLWLVEYQRARSIHGD